MGLMDVRPPRGVAKTELCAFYINREQDDHRRQFIEEQLARAGIAGQRVRGVDGTLVPDDLANFFYEGGSRTTRLSNGEVGCYSSHLRVARTIIEQGCAFALVLEDDAVLPQTLASSITDLIEAAPRGWDVIHLSSDPSHAYRPLGRLPDGREIVTYSRVPAGAVGYLLSAAGAQKLMQPVLRVWPIDTDLRQPWEFGLCVFGVVPKLIGHNDTLRSVILSFGERSRLRRGIRRPSLRHPLGNPLHTPQGAWFNLKRLGPAWWARCLAVNVARRLRGRRPRARSIQPVWRVRSQH